MHKVCNIRDPGLRASLPPREMWRAYSRDVSALMDRAFEGGLASVHSVANPLQREAA